MEAIMDIASLSMTMAQNNTLTAVGTAMLSKSLDTSQVLGQEMVAMIDAAAMERSVNPAIGSNFDVLV